MQTESINITQDGEILYFTKDSLIKKNYKLLNRERNVKNGKVTWTSIWGKSKNEPTEQGSLF